MEHRLVTDGPKKMNRKIKTGNTLPLQFSRRLLQGCDRPGTVDSMLSRMWSPSWNRPSLVRLLPGLEIWSRDTWDIFQGVATGVQWPWLGSDNLASLDCCLFSQPGSPAFPVDFDSFPTPCLSNRSLLHLWEPESISVICNQELIHTCY